MYIEVSYPSDSNLSTAQAPTIVYVQYDDGVNPIRSLSTNVRNNTGSTIPAFSVVYITSAVGNKPVIALASSSSEPSSSKTYGITATSISNNGTGEVVTVGELINIDTSAFTEGQSLWLGSTPGSVVTAPPSTPDHSVFIGYVVRSHPNFGIVDVRIQNGYELQELHDCSIVSKQANQVLKLNSTATLWENKTLLSGLAAPLTSSSSGVAGDMRYDANYVYVCTATNTWKRIALSTW